MGLGCLVLHNLQQPDLFTSAWLLPDSSLPRHPVCVFWIPGLPTSDTAWATDMGITYGLGCGLGFTGSDPLLKPQPLVLIPCWQSYLLPLMLLDTVYDPALREYAASEGQVSRRKSWCCPGCQHMYTCSLIQEDDSSKSKCIWVKIKGKRVVVVAGGLFETTRSEKRSG